MNNPVIAMDDIVILSDMDGTLTPSRQPMTPDFAKEFEELSNGLRFYIVTGSDIGKIKEQIPESVMSKMTGIFASMGNEYYENGKRISKRDFVPEESLIEKLEDYVRNTRYPYQLYPNHIEKRCGMINFCVVGRDCPLEERFKYQAWDKENGERKFIAEELSESYPQYSFEIGGAISVDIVPVGFGKSQAVDKLREIYPNAKIIFFGDRVKEGGNDYAVAKRLLEFGNAEVIEVQDPKDVLEYLKKITGNK